MPESLSNKKLPISVTERILKIANGSNLGTYMILLSGVEYVLSMYTNSPKGTIGMPPADKNDIKTFLPVQYNLNTDLTYKEMLFQINSSIKEVIKNSKAASQYTEYKVIVALENMHNWSEIDISCLDMLFNFKIQNDNIQVDLKYSETISFEMAETILEQYMNFLSIMTKKPDILLSEVNFSIDKNYADAKAEAVIHIEPRTKVEWDIAKVWGDILGLERVGIDDNLFEMGASSYIIVQIAMELSADYVFDINDIFENPTVRSLAEKVKYKKDNWKALMKLNRELAHTAQENEIGQNSLQDDMKLYEKRISRYDSINLNEKSNYKNILLTGATGFLGVHLLHDLLNFTHYELFLLIRGTDEKDSELRIKKIYKHNFNSEIEMKRVHIICGDLVKEKFGLDSNEYIGLANTIDCIINSAANIKHYGNPEDFFNINTDGVKRLIAFSLEGNKKDFHQISTGGVAALEERQCYTLFTEYDDELECNLNSVYLKSKYAAERLVIQARKQGVNGNIYRVGEIFYNSDTKKCQLRHEEIGFYKLFKAFIQLGVIPKDDNKYIDFSFVNYISKAILLLFDKKAIINEIFHLYNSNYICLNQLGDYLIKEGYKLEKMGFATFYETLFNDDENLEIDDNLLSVLLFLHPSRMLTLLQCKKTTKLLEKMNFKWPIVTQDDIHTLIEIFRQIKYLSH